MLKLATRNRGDMLKRALGGENAWLVPTSRAKLLKEAVTPKSTGQKRVEGVLQGLASNAGRAKSLAKLAAGGTVAYLASKAVGGAGSVVFDASKRRLQSLTGPQLAPRTGAIRGTGGNSSSRKSTLKPSSRTSSSSRSQGSSSAKRNKTSSGKKSNSRRNTASKKTTARKKPASRKKSTSRKKTPSRSS
jgi:hypothetical protein